MTRVRFVADELGVAMAKENEKTDWARYVPASCAWLLGLAFVIVGLCCTSLKLDREGLVYVGAGICVATSFIWMWLSFANEELKRRSESDKAARQADAALRRLAALAAVAKELSAVGSPEVVALLKQQVEKVVA